MSTDIGSILVWWGTIFVIGILGLPLIIVLFHKFWDKGYIFSKIFSLIIVTYVILVLGIFKILPFTLVSLSILIFLFLVFNLFFLLNKQNLDKVVKSFKENYKIFIFQELLFLILLVSWSLLRGFAPNIEGLEKYMDWGFINSSLRSKFLPPQDMWFAGSTINYYYFGHLVFSLITKLSGIPSAITYNLSIATVFSITFLSSFSLSSNIVFLLFKKINFQKIILAGLISSLLLTFGGNLHSVYKIIKLNLSQNNNHLNLSQQPLAKSIDSYWYPDATRFIGHDPDTKDKTIHEFPIYSFVVADLHGHMNDIPVVIFFLATLLVLTVSLSPKINWFSDLFLGFILSVCYMTNAWDFAVYGLFFAVLTILLNFQRDGPISLIKSIINGGLVIIFWYLFSLPFSINFIPMMEGIRLSDSHTPFYQLFVLYGGFWLISLPFFLYFLIKQPKNHSSYFIFSLILVATILVLIPEILYIKDIYIYEYRRANTMFKLVYQAFILYSIASGCILIYISKLLKS
ncbi:MAG: DUF2298 domain-containing protein, partial [Candidatus Shapirobacteria bacterium]|nr:DUF2298 domain-containing protein [Candidatus Shapirobacteria bacterium]